MSDSFEKPTVTVIIPHYNSSGTIQRAIDSVLDQTYPATEVIVVDDCSSASHRAVLNGISSDAIRIVYHDKNAGAAAARNTGVSQVTGSHIAFLDADDQWVPEKLQMQLDFMARYNLDFSCTGFNFLSRDGLSGEARIPTDIESIRDVVWGCAISPGTTALFKTSLAKKVGLQDGNFRRLEDWDWLFDVVKATSIRVVPIPLANISASPPPNHAVVQSSISRLFSKRFKEVLHHGFSTLLHFMSYILIEMAANNRNHGKVFRFLICGFLSYLLWPIRDFAYFRHAITVIVNPKSKSGPASKIITPLPPDEKKKVLHFISSLDVGGAERMLVNLVLSESPQEDQSKKPVIVTLRSGGAFEKALFNHGVKVYPLNMNSAWDFPRTVWMLAKLLRSERPDILKCWMYYCNVIGTISCFVSGLRYKTKLIWGIRCSNMDFSQYSQALRFSVKVGAILSQAPDKIISNNNAATRFHVGLGYSRARWSVVDNGVDVNHYKNPIDSADRNRSFREMHGIPEDGFILCVTARNDPMKGYENLVAVTESTPNTWVLAAGSGTDSIKGHERFLALGQVMDVRELLWQSDAFVLPSLFGEGIPNSLLEAMAAGLPVLASDIGDIARIVGPTGIVVPPGDNEKLRQGILRLMEDPDLRDRYGNAARNRAKALFSLEAAYSAFQRELA